MAEGDTVVERFTARGTHRGELLGVAGTGRTIALRGINIFRIENERIIERWGSSTSWTCCASSACFRQADLPLARR